MIVVEISLLASRAAVARYTAKTTWKTMRAGPKTNTVSVTGIGSETDDVTIEFDDSSSIGISLNCKLMDFFLTADTQNVVAKTICQNGKPVENLPGV